MPLLATEIYSEMLFNVFKNKFKEEFRGEVKNTQVGLLAIMD
jgi:hypothetical protein